MRFCLNLLQLNDIILFDDIISDKHIILLLARVHVEVVTMIEPTYIVDNRAAVPFVSLIINKEKTLTMYYTFLSTFFSFWTKTFFDV